MMYDVVTRHSNEVVPQLQRKLVARANSVTRANWA